MRVVIFMPRAFFSCRSLSLFAASIDCNLPTSWPSKMPPPVSRARGMPRSAADLRRFGPSRANAEAVRSSRSDALGSASTMPMPRARSSTFSCRSCRFPSRRRLRRTEESSTSRPGPQWPSLSAWRSSRADAAPRARCLDVSRCSSANIGSAALRALTVGSSSLSTSASSSVYLSSFRRPPATTSKSPFCGSVRSSMMPGHKWQRMLKCQIVVLRYVPSLRLSAL
mmetsp:Transcript_27757/g.74711  ORF Transcript_27757/g.74711 Transcript_27757/m.74711 type:complete len:225 (-) Transcript_27757:243-917(-)